VYCLCVNITVLLPAGVNPVAVNKYFIPYIPYISSYHISYLIYIISYIVSYHISYHISYISYIVSYHISYHHIIYIISYIIFAASIIRVHYDGSHTTNYSNFQTVVFVPQGTIRLKFPSGIDNSCVLFKDVANWWDRELKKQSKYYIVYSWKCYVWCSCIILIFSNKENEKDLLTFLFRNSAKSLFTVRHIICLTQAIQTRVEKMCTRKLAGDL
jgi:hypothetical protein